MNGRAPAVRLGSSWRWAIPVLLILAPLLLWPLGAMLWRGIAPHGSMSTSALGEVLGDRFYWGRAAVTTAQALVSTALALLVGIPTAYVFALIRFPGRGLLRVLFVVPVVLPTLVMAVAFQQLMAPGGWFDAVLAFAGRDPTNLIGTIWIILLAYVFYGVAIVVSIVSGAWANVDAGTEEAARLLGAGRWRRFVHVTLPELRPALLSAAALVFTFAFTSFAIVLVLGSRRLDTLEVTIYRMAIRLVDVPQAAILSFAQLLATLSALVVFVTMRRRVVRRLGQRADRAKRLRQTAWAERALLLLVLITVGPLIVAPIAALVYGAISVGASGDVTAANFAALFRDPADPSLAPARDAIRWSLTFAAGATAIAVVAGSAAALTIVRARGFFGSLLNLPLLLPLAVPAVVLGFAYLVTFTHGWYDLRASPWLVLFAQSLVAYPFVLRSVVAVLRAADPRLPEAARLLGASTWGVWRSVELPITARAIVVGAIFAFVIALGEFGATSLLQRPEFATVPIVIFDALGRPGSDSLGRALALSTVLAAVAGGGYILIERLRFREVGEF